MTLEDDEGFEETPSEALSPGVEGMESGIQADTETVEDGEPNGQPSADASRWQTWYRRLRPLLGYLPTGEYEEDTERDGILSYSVEVHSAIIGLSVGIAAATAGDVELLMALTTVALGVGRLQQQFSETVRYHLLKEPYYALGAAAIGYLGVYVAETGQLPFA